MSSMKVKKVSSLPEVRSTNTLYVVQGSTTDEAILYFTGKDGVELRHTVSRSDVADMIALADDGKGIELTALLPPPTAELAGTLMCLTSNGNIPCWCDGQQWIDLSKYAERVIDTTPVDSSLVKRLRNDLYFGIKLI